RILPYLHNNKIIDFLVSIVPAPTYEVQLNKALQDNDPQELRAALKNYPISHDIINLALQYSHLLTRYSSGLLALQRIYQPILIPLQEYVDNHLAKHADKIQTRISKDLRNTMWTYTPLPDVLINIVTDYVGNTSTYTLPINAMQYLSEKIMMQSPQLMDPTLPMIPYCTDEKGQDF